MALRNSILRLCLLRRRLLQLLLVVMLSACSFLGGRLRLSVFVNFRHEKASVFAHDGPAHHELLLLPRLVTRGPELIVTGCRHERLTMVKYVVLVIVLAR